MKKEQLRIFLVDSDPVFLKSLETEFQQLENSEVEVFSTGELCLENIDKNPDVIILDYQVNKDTVGRLSGIEALDKIKTSKPQIPVIIVSSDDTMDIAAESMRHKAHDYVAKNNTTFFRLQSIITGISKMRSLEKELDWYMRRM